VTLGRAWRHSETWGNNMRSSKFRGALVALVAAVAAGTAPAARADSGTIRINVFKGGWFVGASGGSGILVFHGQYYPISIGGLSAGLVFGASQTALSGQISNITQPSDVEGVYGAGGAGVAFGGGVGGVVLTNQKGAVLQLSGRQTGLMLNADFSGLAITMKPSSQ
jgi:hypothetical protein